MYSHYYNTFCHCACRIYCGFRLICFHYINIPLWGSLQNWHFATPYYQSYYLLPLSSSSTWLSSCPCIRKHFLFHHNIESGTALLGMDLIKVLQLCFNATTADDTPGPNITFTSVMSVAPVLPLIWGCAKRFVHKVKISDSVGPVRKKLCCLPLSLQNAVSKETDRLLKTGIIEKIDASLWVFPITVIQKESGGIRMCVDLW